MPTRTILIVDDEAQIRRAVRHAVENGETRVIEAATAADALAQAAAARPDLIVLDLGLPDASGATVCRELRAWTDVPILVLSARHADGEKVELLDAGADDYVTKPFSTIELEARVRALLRRQRGSDAEQIVRAGDLDIDLVARVVRARGLVVHLTPIEWNLLRVLATSAGRTLTHQQLFRQVWAGQAYGDAQKYLRVHVANLRRKIESDAVRPRYILTEPGVGYRFVAPPGDA